MHIRQREYTVGNILCNADKLLGLLVDTFPGLIPSEAGAKVGDIEVEIRVLVENQASIPAPCLLRHVDWLVRRVTLMRNLTVRPGMSMCPREAFAHARVDDKDLELGFYDYMQAYRSR